MFNICDQSEKLIGLYNIKWHIAIVPDSLSIFSCFCISSNLFICNPGFDIQKEESVKVFPEQQSVQLNKGSVQYVKVQAMKTYSLIGPLQDERGELLLIFLSVRKTLIPC